MRVALLTSTGIRHAYLAQRLASRFELAVVVQEEKGLETSYSGHRDGELIRDHFRRLAAAEEALFGDRAWRDVDVPVRRVGRGLLNTPEIADLLGSARPDAIAIFGCGILKAPLLDLLPSERMLNLHQGLSPYYRGSGTNFWPFVEQRPEYIGVTVHAVDAGTDSGGIIAHGRPIIERGDGLHRIGLKTVIASADILIALLSLLAQGRKIDPIPQWPGGRLYRRKDLTGAAIENARQLEADDFIDRWLERRESAQTELVRLVSLQR